MSFLLPAVASALAGPAISKLGSLLGFAGGGTVPGRKGGKARLAVVHPGEVVMTPQKVKQLRKAKTAAGAKAVLKSAAKARPARIKAKGKKRR